MGLDSFVIFLSTLLFGCRRARAGSSVELSGATGFGALAVGIMPARFAVSPSASVSLRGDGWFFVARDTASFLGATGDRFGIHNETTLGAGLFGELVNVSAGLSLARLSLPICGPQLCGQVRGLAPGASVRLDLFGPYLSGNLGISIDCAGTWFTGGASAVWNGVSVRCSAGPSFGSLLTPDLPKDPPMRLFACLVAVSLPALLASGCLTVSPDECWPNTSGGLGGSKPIPIGAGVGATTGGDYADPPRGPLDNGGAPENPCTAEGPEKPSPKSTCEVPDPAAEWATSWSCSDACSSKCPAPGMSFITVNFSPSEFPFVTTVQDDGTGKAGGYQEAKVNLEFIRIIASTGVEAKWYCPFTIKMPLRTEFMGKIPASLAATISVDVTESVARDMLKSKVPPEIFCIQFVPAVDSAFGTKYPLSGAKATK